MEAEERFWSKVFIGDTDVGVSPVTISDIKRGATWGSLA